MPEGAALVPAQHNPGVRVAASTLSRSLITGPRRTGRVLGVFSCAVYVEFAATNDLVAVETADGLRLPRAATLAARSTERPFAGVRAGDQAQAGDGRLAVGPLALEVVRWWSPRRPRTTTTPTYDVARLTAVTRLLPALAPDLDDHLESLTRALAVASPVRVQIAATALLGLGAGLTPQGDDVLAGVLVSLAAVPSTQPLARLLGAAVTSRAASSTTSISAALLRDAAAGFAVPALVDLVDALNGLDHAGRPTTHEAIDAVVVRLLAVGHTSGAGLAHGAVAGVGLTAAMPARTEVA